MARKNETPSLEARLGELEQLVARMESGELPLDEALKAFERGVQLTRECQKALSDAQLKVQVLVQESGSARLEDFAAARADDESK